MACILPHDRLAPALPTVAGCKRQLVQFVAAMRACKVSAKGLLCCRKHMVKLMHCPPLASVLHPACNLLLLCTLVPQL
jgi:hypothetical protein